MTDDELEAIYKEGCATSHIDGLRAVWLAGLAPAEPLFTPAELVKAKPAAKKEK